MNKYFLFLPLILVLLILIPINVYSDMTVDSVIIGMKLSTLNATHLSSIYSMNIGDNGIKIKALSTSEEKNYTFYRTSTASTFITTLTSISNANANFTINNGGMNDVALNVTGLQIHNLYLNGVIDNTKWHYTSGKNVITIGSARTVEVDYTGTPVISISSTKSNGGSAPGAAPSFTTGFSSSETPLSIDGTRFNLNSHSNTGTTVTLPTGKPFVLKMLLYGSQSSSDVQHVSIFTNLRGNAREIQQSDTIISWDKNQPLSISDPHHYFGPVTISTAPNGNKLELDFTITFANPMAKSDIIIRDWSANLYSSDTYILDAWQAMASSAAPAIPSTPQSTILQSTLPPQQNAITPPQASSTDILSAIKDWSGYSSHPITDSELLKSMNINDATSIPRWVSKTAKWVADGSTSPQEFQAVILYLHQVHAIK